MIVMSLIVLGFAQISRRNQRESLDRQLSTQAFYAAESGVNDARELITTAAQNNQAIPAKKTGLFLSVRLPLNGLNDISMSAVTIPTPYLFATADVKQ